MRSARSRRGGFTLIEILVVIAILAVIGSVAVVKYMSYLREASVDTARMKLREVGKTIEIYYSRNLKYPEMIEDLVTPREEGKQGVLKPGALVDPWKNPIQYVQVANPALGESPFDLVSFGPDGREGTDDDIRYSAMEAEDETETTR
jgi:general secretion pathway protein G